MKVGTLVSYIGQWIPNIFPEDSTLEPNYGIIIEIASYYDGTNICVFWIDAEEAYWHEQTELRVISL
jgi:hypothetical protein|tara:strand:+ start:1724 stop:1924 length:201 start_codon:yes stop_codon:yes gene_type:complete